MKNCTTYECLLKLLTKRLVEEGVKRYETDYYSKEFKTWDHLLVLIYGQLSQAKSLRELEIGFNSQSGIHSMLNHKKIHRSTLSDANDRRQAGCFLWIAEQLMNALPRKKRKDLGKVIRLLDSSPIQLKGFGYPWAEGQKTSRCQGLKLHVEYDAGLEMPMRVVTSAANYNDCTMGQCWLLLENTIYVFDKGYYDFNWWWRINEKQSYFVTRLKQNAAIEVVKRRKVNGEIVLEDNVIKLSNKHPRGGKKNLYQAPLRQVIVSRGDDKKPLVLVTNLFDVSAEEIGGLYKARWGIELFFKWIKQNLKIKKFLGRSENAVKLQLVAGLITYILVGLFKRLFYKNGTLHHALTWIKHNLQVRKVYYLTKGPPKYVSTDNKIFAGVYL